MNTPGRQESKVKPESIERIQGTRYFYNYDIQEITKKDMDNNDEVWYSFVRVALEGYPNYRETFKALLKLYVNTDEELKIVNDYNADVIAKKEDTEAIKAYKDYLNLRETLKTNVHADFDKYNF